MRRWRSEAAARAARAPSSKRDAELDDDNSSVRMRQMLVSPGRKKQSELVRYALSCRVRAVRNRAGDVGIMRKEEQPSEGECGTGVIVA